MAVPVPRAWNKGPALPLSMTRRAVPLNVPGLLTHGRPSGPIDTSVIQCVVFVATMLMMSYYKSDKNCSWMLGAQYNHS